LKGQRAERRSLSQTLWPNTFVEEGSLSNNIFLLRKALGEDPAFSETVPRRGYRFISTIAADTVHAEQHWSLPKKWVVRLAVGALVVIVLAVLVVDVGGLRSRFLHASCSASDSLAYSH
jgi:hypothetical protein